MFLVVLSVIVTPCSVLPCVSSVVPVCYSSVFSTAQNSVRDCSQLWLSFLGIFYIVVKLRIIMVTLRVAQCSVCSAIVTIQ